MAFSHSWHLQNSICEIFPEKHGDHRGFLSETFKVNSLKELGINDTFLQDNHSLSVDKYTFRGLHFQRPPHDQAKLVRVLKGKILDIFLDLRPSSPSYLHHHMIEISDQKFNQIFIPSGFAHGFLTLEKNCEIFYKTSNYYNQSHDVSLAYFDPTLNITLPCSIEEMTISDKDREALMLKDLGDIFK
ncbi:dTDP-4-dehydrorhamnose 3,5-epimerase [Gammaproteobacteria bacterium]|jgi:dTDP-4-dehydrorhamnose 3,5-epimerase|nr:dTDP-4-dehydrorhamnose 3,5-epimerase [Gammaproteobacteria bacterium]